MHKIYNIGEKKGKESKADKRIYPEETRQKKAKQTPRTGIPARHFGFFFHSAPPDPACGTQEKEDIYEAERKAACIRYRRACVKPAAKN